MTVFQWRHDDFNKRLELEIMCVVIYEVAISNEFIFEILYIYVYKLRKQEQVRSIFYTYSAYYLGNFSPFFIKEYSAFHITGITEKYFTYFAGFFNSILNKFGVVLLS